MLSKLSYFGYKGIFGSLTLVAPGKDLLPGASNSTSYVSAQFQSEVLSLVTEA